MKLISGCLRPQSCSLTRHYSTSFILGSEFSTEQLEALNEKDRIERAERLARPRPAWRKVADPLHLFDSTGKFQRMFDWMDGEDPIDSSLVGRKKPELDVEKTPAVKTKTDTA